MKLLAEYINQKSDCDALVLTTIKYPIPASQLGSTCMRDKCCVEMDLNGYLRTPVRRLFQY